MPTHWRMRGENSQSDWLEQFANQRPLCRQRRKILHAWCCFTVPTTAVETRLLPCSRCAEKHPRDHEHASPYTMGAALLLSCSDENGRIATLQLASEVSEIPQRS
jgi:hypothetical protein